MQLCLEPRDCFVVVDPGADESGSEFRGKRFSEFGKSEVLFVELRLSSSDYSLDDCGHFIPAAIGLQSKIVGGAGRNGAIESRLVTLSQSFGDHDPASERTLRH